MGQHIQIGADGYYHPATEEELVELVKWAHEKKLQLRVRGARHTYPAAAIDTDHGPGGLPREISVQLDHYRDLEWVDRARGIVRAQGGCHLALDPYDPQSTLENSLLYQLDAAGFALDTLGGITHQTVAGFLSTGSSGGTTKWHIGENVLEIRLIDGTGKVWQLSREQNADLFNAAGVSVGLLGVISSITFQGVPKFNIKGHEAITTYADCAVDLFGPGSAAKPSLEQWLGSIDYGRILWWPQKGLERVSLWQAERIPSTPDFEPKPFEPLGSDSEMTEALGGVLLTIIGNLDDLGSVPQKLAPVFDKLDDNLDRDLRKLGWNEMVTDLLAKVIIGILEAGADGVLNFPGIDFVGSQLKEHLPQLIPDLYAAFVPLDRDARGGKPQTFQDYGWRGIPMDNGVDDELLPSWFSEIWVPLAKVRQMVNLLKDHFERGGLEATGTYSFEIYASKRTPFWMSPSYGESDIARVDCLWFGRNGGDPVAFYEQFWELLKPLGFRLHWGKYLPNDPLPGKRWAKYFSEQWPRWHDFMRVRKELDPNSIFLTRYWREHLGLEDA
ncbi:MAG: FAD-binding protein [Myxococcota bacterium]